MPTMSRFFSWVVSCIMLVPEIALNRANWAASTCHGWLDADSCDKILLLATDFSTRPDQLSYGSRGKRNSHTAFIERDSESEWLFARVWEHIVRSNRQYGFRIEGIEGALQLIRYREGEEVDWHVDGGGAYDDGGRRKLSMTVQLSDSSDYTGGDFEFLGGALHPFSRIRGTSIVFPSFIAHRVAPVTSGTRYSLVAFIDGEPFR
jgi:PKHD-type hydroxylase